VDRLLDDEKNQILELDIDFRKTGDSVNDEEYN
jgi:hypothetical protein